jgi:hypothetical protein
MVLLRIRNAFNCVVLGVQVLWSCIEYPRQLKFVVVVVRRNPYCYLSASVTALSVTVRMHATGAVLLLCLNAANMSHYLHASLRDFTSGVITTRESPRDTPSPVPHCSDVSVCTLCQTCIWCVLQICSASFSMFSPVVVTTIHDTRDRYST